ncbi:MAG: ACR3 family arsenite efflux transporter [Nitrospiraceae bacterium]|nr:ACR3 family arsenite efflux transporter [Nitrospiraceae bacterium]
MAGTNEESEVTLGKFEKYIYLWIALCGVAGLLLGKLFPRIVHGVNAITVSGVSLPIAVLMFFLMYPAMAKVKLDEVSHAVRNVGPTIMTLIANWLIAPPLMVLLAWLFLDNPDFRAGTILLGISPCTGMVLFWIAFARGNVTQGIVITAVNALSTLLLYAPFAAFYLGVGGVPVPFSLVAVSVLLFVGLPLLAGQISKRLLIRRKGEQWFTGRYLPMMGDLAAGSLLGMLVLLFSSEGQKILEHPLTVALIAVPVSLHFVVMVAGTHLIAWLLRYRYEEAAMVALIGSSTQFEVAIGTAMVVFGLGSGAALATVVGPLIEVPVMVTATKLLRKTRPYFSLNR